MNTVNLNYAISLAHEALSVQSQEPGTVSFKFKDANGGYTNKVPVNMCVGNWMDLTNKQIYKLLIYYYAYRYLPIRSEHIVKKINPQSHLEKFATGLASRPSKQSQILQLEAFITLFMERIESEFTVKNFPRWNDLRLLQGARLYDTLNCALHAEPFKSKLAKKKAAFVGKGFKV